MFNHDKIVRQALRERFVATLRSGETFDGLLVEVDDKTFRFTDAWTITPNQKAPVQGELFLPRSDVLYLQRTTTVSA